MLFLSPFGGFAFEGFFFQKITNLVAKKRLRDVMGVWFFFGGVSSWESNAKFL